MRLVALISGGKDSILALYRARKMGHDVKLLGTMIPIRSDSYMFHFPNIHLVEKISEAIEIPLVKAVTSGIKEKEVIDLRNMLESLDVDGVVTGAIQSQYQKERIDRVCDSLNIKSIAPLWQEDQESIIQDIIDFKFRVIIVGVYALGFDKSWLGREIDSNTLKDLKKLNLKYQISLVGEGGEYESFVLDGPIFKKRIEILHGGTRFDNNRGEYLINKVRVVNKN